MSLRTIGLVVLGTVAVLGPMGCRSTPAIPPENARRIRQYWTLYLQGSPQWEEARAEWVAMGAAEKQALVDLLILDVKQRAGRTELDPLGHPRPAWLRPVGELERLGDAAREPLLGALRRVRDETTVPAYAEALAGVAGLEELRPFFEERGGGETGRFQSRLVLAVAGLDDPRALDLLLSVLQNGSYDWTVRARAAEMLGRVGKGAGERVVSVLEAVLAEERDDFVAGKIRAALDALRAAGARST